MFEKNMKFKVMRCPTCGATLKVGEGETSIVCVYCGNTIVPVSDNVQNQSSKEFGSVLKVEGIKTPSSALAYMELFFEEYDWDAFSFSQTLSIEEIDKLVDSLKMTCADDKNTWITSFKAISVPFTKKVEGCRRILDAVITEYKKSNLDAYSVFDAYKRIVAMIISSKPVVLKKLEKFLEKAKKYGATNVEFYEMKQEIEAINDSFVNNYAKIEDINEVRDFIAEKDANIVRELSLRGINAQKEFEKAKSLIDEKRYVEALGILNFLNGYSNSNEYIKKIDRCFTIADFLEVEGELYYLERSKDAHEVDVYPTKDKMILSTPIVCDIENIITNYADDLYYIDTEQYFRKYSFSKNESKQLIKGAVNKEYSHTYDGRIFLCSINYDGPSTLWEYSIETGELKGLLKDIDRVLSSFENKIIYTAVIKNKDDYGDTINHATTRIIDVDTLNVIDFNEAEIEVSGFIHDYVVYTQKSPNEFNKNLYIRSLEKDSVECLLEKNIYRFANIVSNKILYYVGNARNSSLISINPDGSERREWPLYISNILFEQGGWIYFIRKSGYNAVLCKCHPDGNEFKIIAADIDQFIEIKNGYMYYINDESTLVKVRMDGSNLQNLCDDVESVLSVKEDKIVFVSVDGKSAPTQLGESGKLVKSIYMFDFTNSGIKKLVYDIKSAKQYDENTVYYVSSKELSSSKDVQPEDVDLDVLYSLNVETYESEPLLEKKKAPKGWCYVATCVYGSYDCPEVWTLRRFRDDTLGATWYGRLFIHVYYAISPMFVKLFGKTAWFKRMWQGVLDKIVYKLHENGVEDTPYDDKEW